MEEGSNEVSTSAIPAEERSNEVEKIDLDTSTGIYDGMDEYLATSSISSTGDDLYDEAVMGLLLDDDFDTSQKNRNGSTDDVFLADTKPRTISIIKPEGSNLRPQSARRNSTSEDIDDGNFGRVVLVQPRRFAIYVGNLTWWTSSEDVKKAIQSLGVLDVLDVKIYECRANGQSKGYCLVSFASEGSIKLVSENLEKTDIQGRQPVVKPDSKTSISFFESLSKTRPPSQSGVLQVQPEQSPGIGSRFVGQIPNTVNSYARFGARNFTRSYSHRGMRLMGSGPRNWNGPSRYVPRIPINGLYGLSPRGPPPSASPYGHYDDWRVLPNYTPRAHVNPAFLNRLPMFQFPPDMDYSPSALMPVDDSYKKFQYPNQEDGNEFSPDRGLAMAISPPTSPNRLSSSSYNASKSPSDTKHSPSVLNQLDEEDLLQRNNSICSQAIQRAVNDASNGEYASAIETLVTAISLIRGSKVSKERRCQVLICSLQDTLEGIEHRSYGRQKGARSSELKEKLYSSHRSRSPVKTRESSSRNYYDRGSSSQYGQSKDRRRRTWEERDRSHASQSELADTQSKVSRMDIGKDDYRR